MKDLILKHTLLNALEYDGKANFQAVLGKIISEDPSLKEKIKELIPEINKIIKEINLLTIDEQKKKIDELGIKIEKKIVEDKCLPELPNAVKGKVVMRLAPYPSGPLHIGNARMVVLNDEYVKRYNGKLFLVIDDTIGSEEKPIIPEAYGLIIDGLKWLKIKVHKKLYKSDRMKYFYKIAEQLIKKDIVYVCECKAEILRKDRIEGKACEHRMQSVKENLKKWKKMLDGDYKEGEAVVRLKTSMEHPNPAFRDRVLLRIVERAHPRVNKKYRVWTLLEFSWAVDDHLLGVTHVLRGKDLIIEDIVEKFIWEKMGWNTTQFIHYGMLNLEGLKLSKTQSRKAIEKKVYIGWDDPRTWSLQSLKKRGIRPEAVRKFVIKMGLSEADVSVPAEILYAENRKLIDSISNRYFCVVDPIAISIKGGPTIKNITPLLHPDFPEKGNRKISVNKEKIYIESNDYEKLQGTEVSLMNLFTIKLGISSSFISSEIKYESPKIHWISEPNVKVKIIMPDGTTKTGIAEPYIKKLKINQTVQFQRLGFCRLDEVKKDMIFYFAHK